MGFIWKSTRKTGPLLLSLFAALVLAGILYEKLCERRDRTLYARIGAPVNIGGRSLNLYCSGNGSPVVVFESGGHTAGYGWVNVQPEVAKFTRACWYDRAGYGWSDPAPSPRSFAAIAEELHTLLHTAGVPGPYVLVGATAGAFHVRVYNGLYPKEVVGAVLIQATDTDFQAHQPKKWKGRLTGRPRWLQQVTCRLVKPALIHAGVTRLIPGPEFSHPFGVDFLTPEQQRELTVLSENPEAQLSEGEGCALEQSMADVRASGDFGDRPLRVLASSLGFDTPEPKSAREMTDLNHFWFGEMQPRLAALSSRGQLLVSEDAESPKKILAAVQAVVAEARQRAATAATDAKLAPGP